MEINKTAVSAHVGNPWWKPNACIAYEPSGPTIKSEAGVGCYLFMFELALNVDYHYSF